MAWFIFGNGTLQFNFPGFNLILLYPHPLLLTPWTDVTIRLPDSEINIIVYTLLFTQSGAYFT